MIKLDVLSVTVLLLLTVEVALALSPTMGTIRPEGCLSNEFSKTCKGNRVCFSVTRLGPCCGQCSATQCGVCRTGYTCVGSSCTSSWIIAIGVICGVLILLSIISAALRRHYVRPSGGSAVVLTTTQPVYEQTTVVTHVAPPPQNHYEPDTYVSNATVVTTTTTPAPVVTYPSNQYGAPAGTVYVGGANHEAY